MTAPQSLGLNPAQQFFTLMRAAGPTQMQALRAPVLDTILATLLECGALNLSTAPTAPTTDQASTLWLRPVVPSWAGQGLLFAWDAATTAYVPCTPALFAAALFTAFAGSFGDGNMIAGPFAGAPSDTIGNNGDYALDTTTGDLYGPKASGAWPPTPQNVDPAAMAAAAAALAAAEAAQTTANTALANAADALTAADAAEALAATANTNAAAAVTTANAASATAGTALANAATAQTTANTALSNANAAQVTANTAVTNAATAQATANTAIGTATAAQTTANTAVTNAAAAQSTANTALADATTALTNAAAAQSTASTALTNAAAAQTTANTALADATTPFVGDTGAGGAAGIVPAPPTASATYDEVLGAGGAWVGQKAGFRNRIINGGFPIDQRNNGAAQTYVAGAALAYGPDRWYGYCTGANVTGQRTAGSGHDQFGYTFTGAAGVTGIGFAQRIEQLNSYDMAALTGTLSAVLSNSLSLPVTWSAYYANTANTFGTLASPTKTLIATGTFAATPTPTRFQVPIGVTAPATTGVEIVLSVGAQPSGTWTIENVQFEVGEVASPFERRFADFELFACQRRFEKSYSQTTVPGTNVGSSAGGVFMGCTAGNQAACSYRFAAEKASTPTIICYDNVGNAGKCSTYASGWSNGQGLPNIAVNTANATFQLAAASVILFNFDFIVVCEL